MIKQRQPKAICQRGDGGLAVITDDGEVWVWCGLTTATPDEAWTQLPPLPPITDEEVKP